PSLVHCGSMSCVFFFQAEDGIRDPLVTGVQTCALPILVERVVAFVVPASAVTAEALDHHCQTSGDLASFKRPRRFVFVTAIPKKIGRASCREREEMMEGDV